MNKAITALIADDEAHMRTFLKLILSDLGIEKIYLMQNGMDAVEAYREYKPDIVLMDINMNKLNGLEALELIREIDPEARVVMLTAVSTREAVQTSKNSGAVYYILKTQAPDQIREQLRRVLETAGSAPGSNDPDAAA